METRRRLASSTRTFSWTKPIARITEAEREGWLGEVEGLKVSLAGAEAKLAQIDNRTTVALGMPGLSRVTGRTVTTTSEG